MKSTKQSAKWVAASLGAGLLAAAPALAQQDAALRGVDVQSTREDLQGVAGSASEGVVTSKQLRTRPVLRAGDVMEAVPGLVATQHAGEGKANQYFLRGFNLDHGTDFATFVDGVPVNLPTHGHGQGYTDLYFLLPELVDTITYRKGPYYADTGDFAAAGNVRIRTVRKLDRPFAMLEAGRFGYRRALAAGSVSVKGGDLLLAAERGRDDGPWDVPQGLGRTNLVGKYTLGSADDGITFGVNHHEASWISTDQVPQRAIDNGLIGRFGTLDPTSGGRTKRTSAQVNWARRDGEVRTTVDAYALRYSFDLFSDFTYYTRGCDTAPLPAACDSGPPLDQFEQVDRRHVFGLAASQSRPLRLGGLDAQLAFGTDLRRDDIAEVGLYGTQARARLAQVRSDRARIDALGFWSQLEVQLAPQWRAIGGLRWDHRALDVQSSIAANSGATTASITSPKLSLVWSPGPRTDLYANWGRGFHSNDARGTVLKVDPSDGVTPAQRADPLVRATGYELGLRQKWADNLVVTAAAWVLKLDSELLFVGDAGTTEATRPAARRGIELSANWRPAPAWEIDADLALSRARFSDADPAGDRIPGALPRVASLGITYLSGPWTFGARLRHFGAHPLIEDGSLRGSGSTVVNTRVAYRVTSAAELSLDVFNLFNRQSSDIQYAYASRLPGEPPFADAGTPATLHVHPSLPRTLRVGLRLFF
ncbi:TonB-dependent receptor [Ramlibacter humi]|uniref:TonB-dependent receptor n=1 Tax=Ramlibacter humi TaxID=2530451 RepID=UPI00197FB26F|nr:TonB-dependent receptor [Ramlibacter humi]